MTHKFDLGLARLMDAGTSVYQREKERTTACVAACAGIPTADLTPESCKRDRDALVRARVVIRDLCADGPITHIDKTLAALARGKALLRELGEP